MSAGADLALLRLLQLASPLLPVGAYSYSQGLEAAIAEGTVADAGSAARWIGDVLRYGIGRFEAPLWARMYEAWGEPGPQAIADCNEWFLVTRETAELRAETMQMGYSLRVLLEGLGQLAPEGLARLRTLEPISFPAAFSFAARAWEIDASRALHGYLYSWLENQVSAALKAVPLGQLAGQRMVRELAELIPPIVTAALACRGSRLQNFLPGYAVASARHESQYTRLFRS